MAPAYEQDQVALFCCRETVSLQTLSWVMSDDKWIEILPQMMQRSESLKAVVHANAANYIAKAAGAKTTPRQALTHYAYALKELQTDLYDPVRQKSDETLFAIIILAIFDVDLVFSC
jgi:cell division protein FtsW (lipid II flippase)